MTRNRKGVGTDMRTRRRGGSPHALRAGVLGIALAAGAASGLTTGAASGLDAGLVAGASQPAPALTPAERAARTEALNAMVNTPFPAELWAGLRLIGMPADPNTGTDAEPEPGTDAEGAPATEAPSVRAMFEDTAALMLLFDPTNPAFVNEANLAKRVMARYERHGVAVVGVVPAEHTKAVEEMFEADGLRIGVVADTGGALFERFQHRAGAPVQYVMVDHTHSIRSADLPRRQVRTVLTRIASERRIAENNKDDGTPAAGVTVRGSEAPAGNPLAVLGANTDLADSALYQRARWPRPSTGAAGLAQDFQGRALPAAPGSETWLTEPVDAAGRVVVLDFWATWCGPCIRAEPILESLQQTMGDDVLVAAISGQARGRFPEDENAIRQYLGNKPEGPKYAHAHDPEQRLYKAFGVRSIPHVVVVSTDGTVRWQGTPYDQEFLVAVSQTVRADPGVMARRAAMRSNGADASSGG